MATINAPATGGITHGTGKVDTINGSALSDNLYGHGGNDILNGGDGNDILHGDGAQTFTEAFQATGYATLAYTGAATAAATALSLTALGTSGDQSIWRVRNTSNVDQVITLQSTSQGKGHGGAYTITIIVPAMSDLVIPSNNTSTHKLLSNGKQIATTGVGTQVFDPTTFVPAADGDDVLNGGNGDDTIYGDGGNDTLNGDAGNDILDGGDGSDILNGGDGNDVMTGGAGNDRMFGGAGDDLFQVEWSNSGDYYDGGAGIDTFTADANGLQGYVQEIDLIAGTNNWGDKFISIENLIGGTANDKFWGTEEANSFWGRAGNDLLDGRGGDDKLYGEAGSDTLVGGAGNDLLDGGADDDLLKGGAGADKLLGGAGIDTADYSDSSAGVTVSLLAGVGAGGDAAGDTLVGIENLIGSKFADILTGDANANVFNAAAGNDVVFGSGGGDTIDGGADFDIVDYTDSTAAVTVDLNSGVGTGGFAQGDRLTNVEGLVGSAFDDKLIGNNLANTLSGGLGNDRIEAGDGDDIIEGGEGNDALFGDAGNDILRGGNGNDRITGGLGADRIDGGSGIDTADYRHSAVGVDVNLLRGTGIGGDAQGDTLTFIENLSGSGFADILVGDNGNNRITGMAGEDKIYGMGGNDYIASGGGYDFVDGGDGIDTVTYEDSWDRVVVNLTTGVNQYGEASRDVLVNVENIVGSAFDDKITGDANANRLTGGDGADMLNGMGGNDYLFGGTGNDILTGGAGADVFVFELGGGNDTITDFWAGAGRTDRLWLQTGTGIAPAWSAVDSAAGAIITVEGYGSVTLTGVTVAQLHADDFIFS